MLKFAYQEVTWELKRIHIAGNFYILEAGCCHGYWSPVIPGLTPGLRLAGKN